MQTERIYGNFFQTTFLVAKLFYNSIMSMNIRMSGLGGNTIVRWSVGQATKDIDMKKREDRGLILFL